MSTSKSKGPAPRLEFLGLELDGNTLEFYVPQKKIERIKNTITIVMIFTTILVLFLMINP